MRGVVHHVDLTVLDPERSLSFYEAVMGFMGYQSAKAHVRGFDFDLVTPDGGFCSISIVKAQGEGRGRTHDRYSPGLHHLAWTAESREEVDRLHDLLRQIGATVLSPSNLPPVILPTCFPIPWPCKNFTSFSANSQRKFGEKFLFHETKNRVAVQRIP